MIDVIVRRGGNVRLQAGLLEQSLQCGHVAPGRIDDEGGAIVGGKEEAIATDAVEVWTEAAGAAGQQLGIGPS
ncbi:MAG: hypothetical protein O2782_15225 [bacterium]|nr:hypothetical protein [bacterium]